MGFPHYVANSSAVTETTAVSSELWRVIKIASPYLNKITVDRGHKGSNSEARMLSQQRLSIVNLSQSNCALPRRMVCKTPPSCDVEMQNRIIEKLSTAKCGFNYIANMKYFSLVD